MQEVKAERKISACLTSFFHLSCMKQQYNFMSMKRGPSEEIRQKKYDRARTSRLPTTLPKRMARSSVSSPSS